MHSPLFGNGSEPWTGAAKHAAARNGSWQGGFVRSFCSYFGSTVTRIRW